MLFLAALSIVMAQSAISILTPDNPLDQGHRSPPGTYVAKSADRHAVWVIRGHDFTLDLTARILRAADGPQDSQTGIGILLDGCKNVTLKNVEVSGFRTNIMLRNCTKVRLDGCKANRSRAIRMAAEGKPIATELNLRDLASWRAYGAGIWIEQCEACTVEHNSANAAQNGIVIVDTAHSTLVDNDCSGNGGWGFALWNCLRNTLAWNHADFCNRPTAGGWGGNTAGIVGVNHTESNQFIANSMTHCGDGMILTDRHNDRFDVPAQSYKIEGASNFNFVAHNDGSWASNNAFDATFTEYTLFYENKADESQYGFWLGYSDAQFLIGNEIMRNRVDGINIGQGRQNTIYHNGIIGNQEVGVHIWSASGIEANSHPSANNKVIENQIIQSKLAVSLENSLNPLIQANSIQNAALPPDVKLTAPEMSDVVHFREWTHSKTAIRIDGWLKLQPKGWKFYRDQDKATGPDALKLGDFAPVKP